MSSENWYFTTDTNSKGCTYIKDYQTEWDPVCQAIAEHQS